MRRTDRAEICTHRHCISLETILAHKLEHRSGVLYCRLRPVTDPARRGDPDAAEPSVLPSGFGCDIPGHPPRSRSLLAAVQRGCKMICCSGKSLSFAVPTGNGNRAGRDDFYVSG